MGRLPRLGHKLLTISVRFAPEMLSTRDPASPVVLAPLRSAACDIGCGLRVLVVATNGNSAETSFRRWPFVRLPRLELGTSSLSAMRSNHLSYSRIYKKPPNYKQGFKVVT